MKKKLIAIIASLAMVATLVPATAFAADASRTELAELTTEDKTAVEAFVGGGGDTYMNAVNNKGYNDNLTITKNADGLILRGSLPYLEITKFSNVKDLQKGHYFACGINVAGAAPYMVTKAKRMLETKAGLEVQDETTDVTDLTTGTGGKGHEQLFLYLTKAGHSVKVGDSGSATAAAGKYVSNPSIYKDATLKNIKDWNDIEKDLTQETLTINVDNLTLLTESETESMDDWMSKINAARAEELANSTETKEYARLVTYAREAYETLAPELKEIVINKVDRYATNYNYKNAYKIGRAHV